MAPKEKKHSTVPHKGKFSETLFKISTQFPLGKIFDDFLTMAIASCTQNPVTKLSYYEDEYLQTIAPYKNTELRFEFPNAFAHLISEMEDRVQSESGNDVLGEFFEQHISNGRNSQFFTPYPVCKMMALLMHNGKTDLENSPPLRILDPSCGSGRMLLTAREVFGRNHKYYGIDIDRTCAKMTALNLFLNGMWKSEIMCANALTPDDFVVAYRISLLPFGIFKIEQKEQSALWHLHQQSFQQKNHPGGSIILDSTPFPERPKDNSTQLDLF